MNRDIFYDFFAQNSLQKEAQQHKKRLCNKIFQTIKKIMKRSFLCIFFYISPKQKNKN